MKGLVIIDISETPLLCTEQVLTLNFLFLTLVRSLPTLSVLPLMRSISLQALLKATIPLFSGLTRLTENVKSVLSYPL